MPIPCKRNPVPHHPTTEEWINARPIRFQPLPVLELCTIPLTERKWKEKPIRGAGTAHYQYNAQVCFKIFFFIYKDVLAMQNVGTSGTQYPMRHKKAGGGVWKEKPEFLRRLLGGKPSARKGGVHSELPDWQKLPDRCTGNVFSSTSQDAEKDVVSNARARRTCFPCSTGPKKEYW